MVGPQVTKTRQPNTELDGTNCRSQEQSSVSKEQELAYKVTWAYGQYNPRLEYSDKLRDSVTVSRNPKQRDDEYGNFVLVALKMHPGPNPLQKWTKSRDKEKRTKRNE